MDLITPNSQEVKKYLNRWNSLENYYFQEKSLNKLFNITYPLNNKLEDILTKVSSLNDFYSTNIFNVYAVSKHILELNVDERLEIADVSLVKDISKIVISGKEKCFYSFATKYCSHHKPNDYPIYDKYVVNTLMHFKKLDNFCIFKRNELKDYEIFKSVIETFRDYYNLNQFTLKEIDRYLWQIGRI